MSEHGVEHESEVDGLSSHVESEQIGNEDDVCARCTCGCSKRTSETLLKTFFE